MPLTKRRPRFELGNLVLEIKEVSGEEGVVIRPRQLDDCVQLTIVADQAKLHDAIGEHLASNASHCL